MTLTVDGQPVQAAKDATWGSLYPDRKDVVVVKVDGQLKDLDQPIQDGAQVEAVTLDDPDGLMVLRHSAAHLLAQAVQQINPQAKLGIGPPIENGFYYDFEVETPFTPEDLRQLEKVMTRLAAQGQTFRRRVVSLAEATAELTDEPYKLELIGLKSQADAGQSPGQEGSPGQGAELASTEGALVEVGDGELTIYDNLTRDGQVVWKDLCRGPHVPATTLLKKGSFKLMRSAAAYWRGSEKNQQLQRIYGTAWQDSDQLKAYTDRLAEAERRDHRKLGQELDLFSFPEAIGSGLPVFHPKGGIIRLEMEEYSRQRHLAANYEFVNTPHITKQRLFEISGHLDWYRDGMYPPMHLDEELNADGSIRRQGQDYYLKPMNCPMHNLIFASRGRSYRELPLRLFEFGTVYRYEKSGVVHGLTRARGFSQDDAHIYCSQDQMRDELASLLRFVLELLADYGLEDFYLELSTRDPNKSVGTDQAWEQATQTLEEVGLASGLEIRPDPGGAAFYGPKISVQTRDAIGRSWQISTIQLDFNMPELFNLEYTAADGSRQRPVMIHRALFGSIERFFAILTEHYAGAFPAWLAPIQVRAIPVSAEFEPHLDTVLGQLKARGVRVEMDRSDDRFGKKIRTAAKDKVPFVLIAGADDVAKDAVSFRLRDGSQDNGVPVDQAVERITSLIERRVND
ncbi:MAG: threonine--tRNA ligase [Micrococcales bacterium]|nr:threonine--tRNA ligase [Micrococcales bacterium]